MCHANVIRGSFSAPSSAYDDREDPRPARDDLLHGMLVEQGEIFGEHAPRARRRCRSSRSGQLT